MIKPNFFKVALSTAAAVLAVSAVANAAGPSFVYYATNFDSGVDNVNNTSGAANYNVYTASSPTNHLDQLNGWLSNDPTPNPQSTTTATQTGGSNGVGPVSTFFGGTNAGALGGIYRTQAGAAGAPDVIPGVVTSTLFHSFTLPTLPPTVTLAADFAISSSNTTGTFATQRDSFAFTLGNSSTNLISVNFVPNTSGTQLGNSQDLVSITANGATTAPTGLFAITLNAQFHINLQITTATGAYAVTFTSGANTVVGTLTGTVATPVTAATLTQAGVSWTLATATLANAGSNAIAFDNFTVVPEPSTYAMMSLGFLGLGFVIRFRRQQA